MSPHKEFWQYFQEITADLERSEFSPLRQLYLHLTKIDKRLYLHTGRKDDGQWDLILSAEGVPELMPVVEDLVKSAPEVSGWGYLPCYDGTFVCGERNQELYPDNVNGDTLYRIVRDGDRPWISRDVDFSVVFPDERLADRFLLEFNLEGARFEKSPYDGSEGFTFEIKLTRCMCPTYSNITNYENEIATVASELGGRNDGWGYFQMKNNEQDGISDGG